MRFCCFCTLSKPPNPKASEDFVLAGLRTQLFSSFLFITIVHPIWIGFSDYATFSQLLILFDPYNNPRELILPVEETVICLDSENLNPGIGLWNFPWNQKLPLRKLRGDGSHKDAISGLVAGAGHHSQICQRQAQLLSISSFASRLCPLITGHFRWWNKIHISWQGKENLNIKFLSICLGLLLLLASALPTSPRRMFSIFIL